LLLRLVRPLYQVQVWLLLSVKVGQAPLVAWQGLWVVQVVAVDLAHALP
jgi:hypothetical protein